MDDMYTAIYEKLSTLQWLMKRRQMFSQAQSGPFADSARGQGRIQIGRASCRERV